MLGFATAQRLPREIRLRRRYAEGLEQAVERAGRGGSPFSAAVPVSREAGGAARAALLDLAERLRQPRPVTGYGLLQVRRLLTDGAGPLYTGAPGQLQLQALAALVALEPIAR